MLWFRASSDSLPEQLLCLLLTLLLCIPGSWAGLFLQPAQGCCCSPTGCTWCGCSPSKPNVWPDLASLPVTDTSRNHSKAALCPVVHEGSSSVCWGAGPSRNWQINLLLRKTEGHRNLRRPSVFSNIKALKLKLGDF